jgi:hypothetical protein
MAMISRGDGLSLNMPCGLSVCRLLFISAIYSLGMVKTSHYMINSINTIIIIHTVDIISVIGITLIRGAFTRHNQGPEELTCVLCRDFPH